MKAEKTPQERAAELAKRQADCLERMKQEGKSVLSGKKLVSTPMAHKHIGEWIKPALKAIKRQQKKSQKQQATVTPLVRKVAK